VHFLCLDEKKADSIDKETVTLGGGQNMSSSVGGTLFGPGFESKLLFLEQFRKYTTANTATGKPFEKFVL